MELLSDVLLNNKKNLWWFILNTEKILNNESLIYLYQNNIFSNTNMNNLWLTEIKGKHERLIAQHCTLNK